MVFQIRAPAGPDLDLTAVDGPRLLAYAILERRDTQNIDLRRMLLVDFQTRAIDQNLASAMMFFCSRPLQGGGYSRPGERRLLARKRAASRTARNVSLRAGELDLFLPCHEPLGNRRAQECRVLASHVVRH